LSIWEQQTEWDSWWNDSNNKFRNTYYLGQNCSQPIHFPEHQILWMCTHTSPIFPNTAVKRGLVHGGNVVHYKKKVQGNIWAKDNWTHQDVTWCETPVHTKIA
jgi:hypothetical protein